MVTMDDASEEFPTFAHPGTEFLHLLRGNWSTATATSSTACRPATA